jgi:diketogulonate reductase-like aldo/keto reductase
VSNFNRKEILDLYKATEVIPELNEIQSIPEHYQNLVKWHQQNIATTTYTSLGVSRFQSFGEKDGSNNGWPLILATLAMKCSATEAQVLLR